ncbi:MAG: iron-sulfur cluster assembly accessory protein [Bacteroidetes bacterium]|nr:MAG: iron-sulfur cluster assembly accessory protein [Bacteroidota bacterium]
MDVLTKSAPVNFTPGAIVEIKRLIEEDSINEKGEQLRVGVKGGGCSGLSYVLGFDQKDEKDQEFQIDGINVIMNPAHEIYLFGMEIDWEDGLNSRGFVFKNPNASKTCGCGTSFAV